LQDIEETLEHTTSKLLSLLPSNYKSSRLAAILAQAPTIIFRMDHYRDARTLSDLPQDLVETLLSDQPATSYGIACCDI
jgi:hypothetical protein